MTRYKRYPRGTWMKLKSADDLRDLMVLKDFTAARLARSAKCSRQFIWQLLHEKKNSMKPITAEFIAEALGVPVGLLFLPSVASATDQIVNTERASRRAA